MVVQLFFEKTEMWCLPHKTTGSFIKETFYKLTGAKYQDVYFLHNGKLVSNEHALEDGIVHAIPKLTGGKGGFGSMLRAIGAQIEKTTNREACRDLSGRRLRDINEEKRLKTWIAQQVEREKEAADRKQKKLEKLCEMPKHQFADKTYDKERSDLPEKVEDAVLQGLQAATTKQVGEKRKQTDQNPVQKKKPRLWVDADVDDLSSTSEDESDQEQGKLHHRVEIGESSASCSSSSTVVDVKESS